MDNLNKKKGQSPFDPIDDEEKRLMAPIEKRSGRRSAILSRRKKSPAKRGFL